MRGSDADPDLSGDAAAAKAQIIDVVNRNFRAKVERVDISFWARGLPLL